jgi:putative addiction module component (TIGR02574 family)
MRWYSAVIGFVYHEIGGHPMTQVVEQMKSQALSLSVPERADLAHFLLTSLEPEEEGVEEAWRVEIGRRVAEIRNGSAVGRSADEVLAELEGLYP